MEERSHQENQHARQPDLPDRAQLQLSLALFQRELENFRQLWLFF
jgi:hypothetical protein